MLSACLLFYMLYNGGIKDEYKVDSTKISSGT